MFSLVETLVLRRSKIGSIDKIKLYIYIRTVLRLNNIMLGVGCQADSVNQDFKFSTLSTHVDRLLCEHSVVTLI